MLQAASNIVKTLQKARYEAVFCGGAVRDMLLDIEPKDIDIATSATPTQIESLFERTKTVGKAFGVVLVRFCDYEFEVATFRNDGNYSDNRRPDSVTFSTMIEDAQRRDFTINAMFYDTSRTKVIDYVGGKEDIAFKLIRFVGNADDRIKEDNLRLLRAIRFALRFDFDFERFTFSAIKRHARLVKNVALERIKEEFVKMIMIGKPRRMFKLLLDTGLMQQILPEVVEMVGSPQNPKHHREGDVMEHVILVMEKLIGQSLELQLAGMFHDIGKPRTLVFEDGQPTNKGHDKVGAEMTEEIMLRLKFSNEEIELVKNLVSDHMKHHIVKEFRKSTLKRYMSLPYFNDLMILNEADTLSASGDMEHIEFLKEKMNEWEPEIIHPKTSLISGRDLIKLGFKPGPIFGTILREVEELQLEEILTTYKGAIKHVKKRFK